MIHESTKFSSIQKKHARTQVYVKLPSPYENYSVQKFTNARARNFYVCENLCDYSIQEEICFSFSFHLSFLIFDKCNSIIISFHCYSVSGQRCLFGFGHVTKEHTYRHRIRRAGQRG